MSKPNQPAFVAMPFEAWEKAFKPVKNTITPDAPFDGAMFETFGADLSEVLIWGNGKGRHLKVWTLIEGDEGQYVVDGYRIVNRLGYFLTSEPATKGTQYEVNVD